MIKKYIGYIPAILFSVLYLCAGFTGFSFDWSVILIWIACFFLAAFFLHKGIFWGGIFGLFPAVHMIYMGTQDTGQVINIEIPLGLVLLLFYGGLIFYRWKNKEMDTQKVENKEVFTVFVKIILTIAAIIVSSYAAVISVMILVSEGVHYILAYIGMIVVPSLLVPLIWLKKRKKFMIVWLCAAGIYFVALGVNYGMVKYDESININTAPNINVHEYLPFEEDSKIVKMESKTLKLTEDLPIIDGAAPTAENIKNGSYPIVTPIYAVTYEENAKENVDRLVEWILSEEGQEILEKTGYVGIASE